jgi:hypothetical protein
MSEQVQKAVVFGALGFLGVSFVAFCIWLTVRIVNRRERWAKRTAATIAAVVILYPLSMGPAMWLWVHAVPDSLSPKFQVVAGVVYSPLWPIFSHSDLFRQMSSAYQRIWVSDDEAMERWKKDHQK